METEIPAIFRSRETILPERFTFHSSRMRMKKVTKEELEAMDAMSLKCAQELSDAHVDVMGYACLVAIMSMGRGYHCVSEVNLHQETVANDFPTPIVTSAGALINGLKVFKNVNAQNKNYVRLRVWGKANFLSNFKVITLSIFLTMLTSENLSV